MKKILFVTHILAICCLILSGCQAQTKGNQSNKEIESSKSPVTEKKVVVVDNYWKEFKDLAANISIDFCGEPRKDVLNDTFNGENINRNSYLVLDNDANGNARYFLGWFDWKLKNEDENSLRKLYDEYSKDILKDDPRSLIKETKEIKVSGKLGRETTFAAKIQIH